MIALPLSVPEQKEKKLEESAAWLERLTIAGAAARGFVYLVIGATALRATGWTASEKHDFPGAFKTIALAPFGRVLLVLVGVGLAAFAVARVLEAVLVLRRRASEEWLAQSGGAITALIYGGLAFVALRIAYAPSTDQSGRAAEWAALLLAQPLGRSLLGLIGVIVAGVGVYQFGHAFRRRALPLWTLCLAIYGRVIYAFLLFLFGAFALVAAIFRSPGEARGMNGTLSFLQDRLFGSLILTVFGFGLLVHGVMSAIEAVRDSQKTAEEES